jgi:MFS transporter, DHA2 family, multidrug resistance protein
VAEIVRSTAMNYSRMTEMITPYNELLSVPGVMGGWTVETLQGLSRLGREIDRQAAMIGYVNAFGLYTVVSGVAIGLAMLARRGRRAAG